MPRTLPHILSVAALAIALPFAASAQEKDSKGGSATDAGFVTNASGAGLAEIGAAKLADTNASSDKVRTFAKRVIDDHTKASDELKRIAAGDRGYATAENPPPAEQKDINALQHLEGPMFDKEFTKVMIADHEKAIAIFEVEAEKGSNKELQAFAKKMLPTLREHLKMAKALSGGK